MTIEKKKETNYKLYCYLSDKFAKRLIAQNMFLFFGFEHLIVETIKNPQKITKY